MQIFLIKIFLNFIDVDAWNKLFNGYRNALDNKCHSLSRFQCDDYVYSSDLKSYRKDSENNHLFYNAESCASEVLSGNIMKVSLYLIGALITLLLL